MKIGAMTEVIACVSFSLSGVDSSLLIGRNAAYNERAARKKVHAKLLFTAIELPIVRGGFRTLSPLFHICIASMNECTTNRRMNDDSICCCLMW